MKIKYTYIGLRNDCGHQLVKMHELENGDYILEEGDKMSMITRKEFMQLQANYYGYSIDFRVSNDIDK